MCERPSKTIMDYPLFAQGPWMIVGTGPSYTAAKRFSGLIVAINDAVTKLDLWHYGCRGKVYAVICVDIECYERVAKAPVPHHQFWLPRVMHENEQPMERPIEQYGRASILSNSERIWWFRLNEDHPDSVKAYGNTSEAAFEILARSGRWPVVFTAGIDGGRGHHPDFENIQRKPESAGYDNQFAGLREIEERTGVKLVRVEP